MKFRYYIVDVFSPVPFGGNQLAVLPEASGLSSDGMQRIAREFNFPETAFVLPAEDGDSTCRVRIFTPRAELPFAGHPTVGTACALAMSGRFGAGPRYDLVLQEGVGPVAVEVELRDGVLNGTLTLTANVDLPTVSPSPGMLAEVLSVQPEEIKTVFFAGVGLAFCFVELASPSAVDRAVLDKASWSKHLAAGWSPHVYFFAGDLADGGELYARMFGPALGVEEDPATGSACAALVGALAAKSDLMSGLFRLTIRQGVAMGRPSLIEATARKLDGAVQSVSVGGATAYVATGEIEAPATFLA